MPKKTANCGTCGTAKIVLSSGATRCLDCHNRRGREYYRSSAVRREKMRRTYVQRKYGMTLERLELMLQQ